MNGFLIANKPTGMTSSNLVVFVRRRLPKGTAIGHGGTLDPEASGVLPMCIGKATRLFDYIIDKTKDLRGRASAGRRSRTLRTRPGTVLEDEAVYARRRRSCEATLPEFVGEIEQIPPMYSAIKRDGKRLYQLARKGETVALEPRSMPRGRRAAAGKVRRKPLPHPRGLRQGRLHSHAVPRHRSACWAAARTWRRLSARRAGVFTLENALTQEADRHAEQRKAGWRQRFCRMDAPLGHLPALHVGEAGARTP